MAHLRTQIRAAFRSSLIGLVTTADRVFTSRSTPIPEAKLPALVIETNSEDSEPFDLQDEASERTLTVLVIGRAKVSDQLDDVLDQIALEVEQAIAATGAGLDGIAESVAYAGMRMGHSADLEKPAGEIRLAYTVRYMPQTENPQQTA